MKDTRNGAHTQQQLTGGEASELALAGSDGIDRRNFLSCTACADTRLLWTGAGFSFVQVSHIGFNEAANQDLIGRLKLALALDKVDRLPVAPDLP